MASTRLERRFAAFDSFSSSFMLPDWTTSLIWLRFCVKMRLQMLLLHKTFWHWTHFWNVSKTFPLTSLYASTSSSSSLRSLLSAFLDNFSSDIFSRTSSSSSRSLVEISSIFSTITAEKKTIGTAVWKSVWWRKTVLTFLLIAVNSAK